ncbi:MAG TPA: TolC family protein [Bryobacteraceae bacterium]|nr:TolC family protein [Bryobacteraceae bacterium]
MRVVYVCLLWAWCLAAQAQSLDALVAEALRNNREILAAQKRYEAARERPGQESSLPDPTVSVGWVSNGNPLPGAGLGTSVTSNIGLMVSQEMPFPGKRKLRGEIAAREADAEFQQYLAVRRSVVARLKQAYHMLHHAREAMDTVIENQALLHNFIQVAEVRYSVGRAAQQDIFRAQTQYAIYEAQRLRLEQERISREAEMNSLLNRPPGGSFQLPDELTPPPLDVTLEQLRARSRTQAPQLRRDQKVIERSELAADLARRDYYPDYTVSGGYFNQGGMPPMYEVRLDVKLPAYFWRKQRAALNEQADRIREARHSYEAEQQTLDARIQDDFVTAQTSMRLMDLYQKSVIPSAKLALESSMASYETGALEFLSLLTNFMTVVDYELNYHEEMMRYYLALDRLEEVTGLLLDR